MRELGACVSLLGEFQPLAMTACTRNGQKMARLAKVTGRRDCKAFSLALMFHLVSIFPRVLEYAICLFLTPFVFSSCTVPAPGNR